MPIGTIINVCTVLIGSTIGLLLGNRFPEKIHHIVFEGLGLVTLLLGLQMAFKVDNPLILIFSILIGGIVGEWFCLDERFTQIGNIFKNALRSKNTDFTEGLITAFLLFCIGPFTILGAFNEGLRGDHSLLFTKAILDGFASIALSVTFGSGVIFSVIPLFIYQAGLTFFSGFLKPIFTQHVIVELTAVGGLLILGIGLNLLEVKKIKVANFLPALIVVVILSLLFT